MTPRCVYNQHVLSCLSSCDPAGTVPFISIVCHMFYLFLCYRKQKAACFSWCDSAHHTLPRTAIYCKAQNSVEKESFTWTIMTCNEVRARCKRAAWCCSTVVWRGPRVARVQEEVMVLERILLQTIKFDLQVEHPYQFLLRYAKQLKGTQRLLIVDITTYANKL